MMSMCTVQSQDENMTLVYGALKNKVAPDVPGNTMTSGLVKLFQDGRSTFKVI